MAYICSKLLVWNSPGFPPSSEFLQVQTGLFKKSHKLNSFFWVNEQMCKLVCFYLLKNSVLVTVCTFPAILSMMKAMMEHVRLITWEASRDTEQLLEKQSWTLDVCWACGPAPGIRTPPEHSLPLTWYGSFFIHHSLTFNHEVKYLT